MFDPQTKLPYARVPRESSQAPENYSSPSEHQLFQFNLR